MTWKLRPRGEMPSYIVRLHKKIYKERYGEEGENVHRAELFKIMYGQEKEDNGQEKEDNGQEKEDK